MERIWVILRLSVSDSVIKHRFLSEKARDEWFPAVTLPSHPNVQPPAPSQILQPHHWSRWCKRTLSYSLNSTFTSRFTRTITAKKENTELINADRKPYKNDNLKYNKWLRKRAKITEKTILTRSVRQLRIQLSDWFTWTKNKTLY